MAECSPIDEMINDPISVRIRKRLKCDGVRFHASDNISEYLFDDELEELVDELEGKFTAVLDTLLIDRENDPNSEGTPRRLAKMYIYELMSGRYEPKPRCTAFPNIDPETAFSGMLVTKAEIISLCSHHHQPVKGICHIGIIPGTKVLGLSKYTRIAQWCARRGTLQEELTNTIAKEIIAETGIENMGVVINATHGCVDSRGVMAHDSSTITAALLGDFRSESVKSEFFEHIKMIGNR